MADTYRPQMRPPGRPVSSDLRTPVAWRQREQNFQHGQHYNHVHNNDINHHHHHHHHVRPSPSPVSTTTDDTSSEVETSVSGRRYNRLQSAAVPYGRNTNTIRSTRSVPALNLAAAAAAATTWDGEPCPVHGHHVMHHALPHPHLGFQRRSAYSPYSHTISGHLGGPMRRSGSMFDMRMAGAASPSYYPNSSLYNPHPIPSFLGAPPASSSVHAAGRTTLEKKSHYGSLRSLHSARMGVANLGPPPYHLPPMPPPHLLPPGMRPRPLVIPAGAEPLPVRDPTKGKTSGKMSSGLLGSSKAMEMGDRKRSRRSRHCCRGPLPLVWFIISIVTVGVVLGVVLGSIYG